MRRSSPRLPSRAAASGASGDTGGRSANPTYKEVSAGRTDHAEAVEVVYDPGRITYSKLLEVFWRNHDPGDRAVLRCRQPVQSGYLRA